MFLSSRPIRKALVCVLTRTSSKMTSSSNTLAKSFQSPPSDGACTNMTKRASNTFISCRSAKESLLMQQRRATSADSATIRATRTVLSTNGSLAIDSAWASSPSAALKPEKNSLSTTMSTATVPTPNPVTAANQTAPVSLAARHKPTTVEPSSHPTSKKLSVSSAMRIGRMPLTPKSRARRRPLRTMKNISIASS